MGGVHAKFTNFFDFRLRSSRYEKDFFASVIKTMVGILVKIFQMSGRWFPWHLDPGVFFQT